MGRASRRKRARDLQRARETAKWLAAEYGNELSKGSLSRLMSDLVTGEGQFADPIGYVVGCETIRIVLDSFGFKAVTTQTIAMKLPEFMAQADQCIAETGIDPNRFVSHEEAVALGVVPPDADDDTIAGFDDPSGETCPKCGQEVDRDEEHDWVHVYRSTDGRCVALGIACAIDMKD